MMALRFLLRKTQLKKHTTMDERNNLMRNRARTSKGKPSQSFQSPGNLGVQPEENTGRRDQAQFVVDHFSGVPRSTPAFTILENIDL